MRRRSTGSHHSPDQWVKVTSPLDQSKPTLGITGVQPTAAPSRFQLGARGGPVIGVRRGRQRAPTRPRPTRPDVAPACSRNQPIVPSRSHSLVLPRCLLTESRKGGLFIFPRRGDRAQHCRTHALLRGLISRNASGDADDASAAATHGVSVPTTTGTSTARSSEPSCKGSPNPTVVAAP